MDLLEPCFLPSFPLPLTWGSLEPDSELPRLGTRGGFRPCVSLNRAADNRNVGVDTPPFF